MTDARPSQYKPDFARIAGRLCRNGATDIEVADILGISVRTFYRWCLQHDDFTAAISVGKEAADDRVERSLYQRAVGYDYTAEKIVTPPGGGPVVMFYNVHVPADVRAALHWLAMRRPRPWARVPEPDADLAHIIGERRKQVAEESERQAAEQQGRFKAAVESEVARRLAGDTGRRSHKTKGPPLVATALP
ncbi:MAG: transposase [Sphingomonas bacterium]|uniref:helix-turn-helix domain-containing protein n=1 Tax=Sphingomonas bacterium TaxID=1895847 RepID=UPI00261EFC76|nr:helix-turn-helix domain-containing protein [Sphingomonas bacterium]MDB5711874.1 transposase [Sphingomonas bacterium]